MGLFWPKRVGKKQMAARIGKRRTRKAFRPWVCAINQIGTNRGAQRRLNGVNRQKRRNRGISPTPQYAYSRLKSGDKPAALYSLTGWEAKL